MPGAFGPARATARYLVLGRRGVECVDVRTADMTANLFVRGVRQFGFLPANGLLCMPPHSCACSVSDLIKDGFLAPAPERADDEEIEPASEAALERRPAFGFEPSEEKMVRGTHPTPGRECVFRGRPDELSGWRHPMASRVYEKPGPRGMGLGSPTQDSALGGPFQPMVHRQDADATKPHGQDASAASHTPCQAWSHPIPVLAQALLLANDTLFVAGPQDPLNHVAHKPAEVDPLAAARESTRGGRLLALALAGGKMLAEEPLQSPPVFDGLAAAAGRLYLASKAGEIVCLGGK
jgi:hypothetical protein